MAAEIAACRALPEGPAGRFNEAAANGRGNGLAGDDAQTLPALQ